MLKVVINIGVEDNTEAVKLLKKHNCIDKVLKDLDNAGYNHLKIKQIVTESVNKFYEEIQK